MTRMTHTNLMDHLLLAGPIMAPDLSPGTAPATESPFGKHLIIDLYGCNERMLHAADIAVYAEDCVELLGMKAYGPPWIHDFGHALPKTSGHTLFQPIETSAITGHMVNAKRTVHLDLFSCQEFDDERALRHAENFFGADPELTVVTVLYR